MKDYQPAQPTDECICHHMIKSHKQSVKWIKKKGQMDCRCLFIMLGSI